MPPVIIDLPHLRRILTELLQNACKYTLSREAIILSDQGTLETIEMRVSNSVVGISPKECDRIFNEVYRTPLVMTPGSMAVRG